MFGAQRGIDGADAEQHVERPARAHRLDDGGDPARGDREVVETVPRGAPPGVQLAERREHPDRRHPQQGHVRPREVARVQDQLAEPAVREAVFPRLREEYRRTEAAICRLTGQGDLLDEAPWLQRSIRVRNPYVDPMNYVQVALLRRLRGRPGEAEAEEISTEDVVKRILWAWVLTIPASGVMACTAPSLYSSPLYITGDTPLWEVDMSRYRSILSTAVLVEGICASIQMSEPLPRLPTDW